MNWRKRRIKPYEELQYEPTNVRELLTEMKDLSEIMTSLAYSALILDSDPIAEEVEAMAARMDLLKYHMRITAALSVRTVEEAEQTAGVLQVVDASETIANAAADLVELLDANVQLRPFLGKVLDEADDRIATIPVPENSPAIGSTLGSLSLESNTGLRVLAIRRGKKWIYTPNAGNQFLPGDSLLVRGQMEGAAHFRRWLEGLEAEL